MEYTNKEKIETGPTIAAAKGQSFSNEGSKDNLTSYHEFWSKVATESDQPVPVVENSNKHIESIKIKNS